MSTYNPKSIKELITNARGQLIGLYSGAILVSLLVGTIEITITSIADTSRAATVGSYLISYVITMIIDVLMGVLVFGKARFFLNLARGKYPLMVSDVFYGIKNSTDKAIVIQALYTASQLLISLPLILMNVGYISVTDAEYTKISAVCIGISIIVLIALQLFIGLSFYILNDHPEMSAKEVLFESMRLMENKKGRYICLCLSLIPLGIVGFLACGIGYFWFSALQNTVLANFYLDTIGEEPFNPTVEKTTTENPTPQSDPYDYSI